MSGSNGKLSTATLGVVQETLLTPLCARADQFGRNDPIVVDPAAAKLVSQIDYDFDRIRAYPDTLTGCAIRAAIFDSWIKEFLSVHPTGTLVLVGEGLDTTFERNDNGRARWFELDFPDVIDLRSKLFEPSPRRQHIAGDALEGKWIDQVRESAGSGYLFQAAGVLMYLKHPQVLRLFTLLADNFPGSTFLFDCCSTMAVRNSGRWEATVRTTRARYGWGIDDPRAIQAWDRRFDVTDVRYMLDYHRSQWRWRTRFASTLSRSLRHAYQVNRSVLQQ